MPEIRQALAELHRLGLNLDPAVTAAAAEERRVHLNTRVYPLYRAVGFQLILLMVLAHNAAMFGEIRWAGFLALFAATQVYVAASWLVVRRWFTAVPALGDWDLADFFFLADVVLWVWVIAFTGGTASWLFLLPLVRVADHRGAPRVFAFAAAAPLCYLVVVAGSAVAGAEISWGMEGVKLGILAIAAYYIAWTGRHVRSLQEQREAALAVAGGLVWRLRERTERLDHANRARSDLMARVRDGLRGPLVEIVGFSRSMLRGGGPRAAAEHDYLQRIHQQARWILRILDDLGERTDLTTAAPEVSLAGVLQEAVRQERDAAAPDEDRSAATVELPDGDAEIRADPRRLGALIGHLVSAARHFGDGPPAATLRLDPVTGIADAIEVAARRAPVPAGGAVAALTETGDLLNPFSVTAAGNQEEVGARFELRLAQSLAELLGYRLEVERTPGLRLTIRLR